MDVIETQVNDTVLVGVTEVTVISEGLQGPAGPVQIHVASTPPLNPQVNQLWLEI